MMLAMARAIRIARTREEHIKRATGSFTAVDAERKRPRTNNPRELKALKRKAAGGGPSARAGGSPRRARRVRDVGGGVGCRHLDDGFRARRALCRRSVPQSLREAPARRKGHRVRERPEGGRSLVRRRRADAGCRHRFRSTVGFLADAASVREGGRRRADRSPRGRRGRRGVGGEEFEDLRRGASRRTGLVARRRGCSCGASRRLRRRVLVVPVACGRRRPRHPGHVVHRGHRHPPSSSPRSRSSSTRRSLTATCSTRARKPSISPSAILKARGITASRSTVRCSRSWTASSAGGTRSETIWRGCRVRWSTPLGGATASPAGSGGVTLLSRDPPSAQTPDAPRPLSGEIADAATADPNAADAEGVSDAS